MDCKDLESLVTPYVDGEVTPEQCAAIEAHLSACPECRRCADAESGARAVVKRCRGALRAPGAAPRSTRNAGSSPPSMPDAAALATAGADRQPGNSPPITRRNRSPRRRDCLRPFRPSSAPAPHGALSPAAGRGSGAALRLALVGARLARRHADARPRRRARVRSGERPRHRARRAAGRGSSPLPARRLQARARRSGGDGRALAEEPRLVRQGAGRRRRATTCSSSRCAAASMAIARSWRTRSIVTRAGIVSLFIFPDDDGRRRANLEIMGQRELIWSQGGRSYAVVADGDAADVARAQGVLLAEAVAGRCSEPMRDASGVVTCSREMPDGWWPAPRRSDSDSPRSRSSRTAWAAAPQRDRVRAADDNKVKAATEAGICTAKTKTPQLAFNLKDMDGKTSIWPTTRGRS